MSHDFRLRCSVCGRVPKTQPLDTFEVLRDPRLGTDRESEIFARAKGFIRATRPVAAGGSARST
jgi:hypothetical protein